MKPDKDTLPATDEELVEETYSDVNHTKDETECNCGIIEFLSLHLFWKFYIYHMIQIHVSQICDISPGVGCPETTNLIMLT